VEIVMKIEVNYAQLPIHSASYVDFLVEIKTPIAPIPLIMIVKRPSHPNSDSLLESVKEAVREKMEEMKLATPQECWAMFEGEIVLYECDLLVRKKEEG
jgi:hypothetical protein